MELMYIPYIITQMITQFPSEIVMLRFGFIDFDLIFRSTI